MLLPLPLLILTATSSLAKIGRHDWHPGHNLVKRQGPQGTTEQSAASIESPTEECSPYGIIPPAILSSFPTVWTVADILANDTEAITFMQNINSSGLIPTSISPRGTPPTSYSGAGLIGTYDLATDPDCWWTDKGCSQPKHPGIIADVVACPEPQTWGYTFDDGPNCTHNVLYDTWKNANQHVSLMYIGSNVLDWPLEAQRAITDGHHVCAHTWSHRYMTSLTTDQAFAELWYSIKAIKTVMGVTVTCWRPPYGDIDDRIRAIAQSMGLTTIMWSDDTNDWNIEPFGPEPTASIQANYNAFKSMGSSPAAATGGVIVLEHEIESTAMNLSIQEYPQIKAAWKNVVPVGACLNITKPYLEDYTFPNFADYVAGNVNPSPSGQISFTIAAVSLSLTALPTASTTDSSVPTATSVASGSAAVTAAPVVGPGAAAAAAASTTSGAAASVFSGGSSGGSSSSSSSGSISSGALNVSPSHPLLFFVPFCAALFKTLV